MKRLLFIIVSLFLGTEMLVAYNPPKDAADVLSYDVSLNGDWHRRFGHVALYDPSKDSILEVVWKTDVIRNDTVESMKNDKYLGVRYGKAKHLGRKVLDAGYAQQKFRPVYRLTPYYREGGWGYSWKFSWRKGLYKSWHLKRARFRCDSFINYCYKKGTGNRLIKYQWKTTPSATFDALPYKR